jgi:hypothetical protein
MKLSLQFRLMAVALRQRWHLLLSDAAESSSVFSCTELADCPQTRESTREARAVKSHSESYNSSFVHPDLPAASTTMQDDNQGHWRRRKGRRWVGVPGSVGQP